MATLKNGIFGGMQGKVGNTVYYILNGKQVARKVGKAAKEPTLAQLANRQAMSVVIDFLRPLGEFIKIGFGPEAASRKIYPQNVAVGFNKSYALKGKYPDLEMDYSKVRLSYGDMMEIENPEATWSGNAEEGYSLWFNWEIGILGKEWPRCNDVVMLLAYFPEVASLDDAGNLTDVMHAQACIKTDGARRKEGQDVMEIPAELLGRPMEVFIAARSEDDKMMADSRYLGKIVIS